MGDTRFYVKDGNDVVQLLFEKLELLETLARKALRKIMASHEEQTALLNQIADRYDKGIQEVLDAIQQLKDAQAAAGNTTPEEDAATARLQAGAEALDNITPDAPPVP